jgi:signal transduction histidine kinase
LVGSAVQHQERLVNALLTLATSERGVEVWESLDLAQITETVLTGRRHDAETRNINIQASLPAAPTTGDPKLVELLVANLIDNALRHNNPAGSIDISTISAQGRATITVTNTGPTVPPIKIDRLFQPFQQADSPRTGHTGGHGLGLAIVGAIAKAHHAKITAHPRPHGGLDIAVAFDSPGTNPPNP